MMKIATTRFPLPRFGESKPAQQPGQTPEPEQGGQYVLEPLSGDELGDLFVPSSPPQAKPEADPETPAGQESPRSTEALEEEVRTLREQLAALQAQLGKQDEPAEPAATSITETGTKAEPGAKSTTDKDTATKTTAAPTSQSEPTPAEQAGPRQYDAAQTMALVQHVLNRNIHGIVNALENGADPNVAYHNYKTPIVWAARHGLPKLIELMLDKGAQDPQALSEAFYELVNAAMRDRESRDARLDAANRLIDLGASSTHMNFNQIRESEWLQAAVKSGALAILQLVLKAGSNDTKSLNKAFQKALLNADMAKRNDHDRNVWLAMAQLLQEAVTDPQTKQKMGDKLQHSMGSQDVYQLDFLEAPPADKKQSDQDAQAGDSAARSTGSGTRQTPKKYSALATNALMTALRGNNLKGVRDALKNGANPNVEYEGGKTPVMRAVLKHDRELLQVLLEAGANDPAALSKALEYTLQSALHLYDRPTHTKLKEFREERFAMARLLQAAGAQASQKPEYEDVLVEAAKKGDIEIVQLLRDAGRDLTSRGGLPLEMAALCRQMDMLMYLYEAGLNDQAFLNKAFEEATRSAMYESDKKFVPEDYLKVANFLLEKGAAPDLNELLLDSVEQKRRIAITQFLLKNGASPRYRDSDTKISALEQAIVKDNQAVAKMLLNGNHYSARDASKALSVAIESGQVWIVPALLNAGADPKTKTKSGESLVEWIAGTIHPADAPYRLSHLMQIVGELMNAGADDQAAYDYLRYMNDRYGKLQLDAEEVREVSPRDLAAHNTATQYLDDRMQAQGVAATEEELRAAGYKVKDGWVYGYRSRSGRNHNHYEQDHIYTSRVDTNSREMRDGIYMFPTKEQVLSTYAHFDSDVVKVRARIGSIVLVEDSTGSDKGKARTHTIEAVKKHWWQG